jgi:hypothetical protein
MPSLVDSSPVKSIGAAYPCRGSMRMKPGAGLDHSPRCGPLTTENGECSKVSHAKAVFLFNRQHLMPACNNKQCDYGCEHAVFEALFHGVINSNKNRNLVKREI